MTLHGKLCIKTSTAVQEPIEHPPGESEFYACVKRGAALIGMRLLTEDWRLAVKLIVRLRAHSSAAQGFVGSRDGLGRQRHASNRFLWPQDKVSKGELWKNQVKTEDQFSVCLTKAIH